MSDFSRVSLVEKNLEKEVSFEQVSEEGKDQDSETALQEYRVGNVTMMG